MQPGGLQRLDLLGEQRAVGRQRNFYRQLGEHRHQALQVTTHQRLAAGEPDLLHAELDEDAREARDFLEAQDRAVRKKLMVRIEHFARHAIDAAEVAAIGHRDAQIAHRTRARVDPRVFVLWRMDDDKALPLQVTVSSDEAARWLDGGHSVDGVAMPAEIYAWVGAYVESNYRPEPKKRIKPRSFMDPKQRA